MEAAEILNNVDETRVSFVPAVQPLGGSIFLYNTKVNNRDWRADIYNWINYGSVKMPIKNPIIKKEYFYVKKQCYKVEHKFSES